MSREDLTDWRPAHVAVSRCVFMQGQHIYRGADCPHERESDEMGEIKPSGWTVQQG